MFNKANRIIGGLTIKYLLEKTRVVALGPGERNYHVFYQIHQLPAAELASLGLTEEKYRELVRGSGAGGSSSGAAQAEGIVGGRGGARGCAAEVAVQQPDTGQGEA